MSVFHDGFALDTESPQFQTFDQIKKMIIEEMQTYYGQRAPEYDSSMGYNDPEKVRELAPIIAELQQILSSRHVLEIACGPCFWTQYAAQVSQSVTATDYNESVLIEAKKKPLPWDRVKLLQADAYNLENTPGEFDAAFAVDWLAHVPRGKIVQFLKQVIDRVSTSSPISFIDQLPGAHSMTGIVDDDGNHIQPRELADGTTFHVIKNFFSDADLQEIFSQFKGDLSIKRFPDCRRLMVTFTSQKS